MPIKIPDQLPAAEVLGQENIFVMTESRAVTQNIRPLRVLILNLMPKKIETEIQLMRMLSNSPLQVDVDLLRIDDRESKNTPQAHLENFYHDFEQVRGNNYDGMIITGAPLGLVEFEEVVYWPRIVEIIEWSHQHVTSTLFLCWAVQAGIISCQASRQRRRRHPRQLCRRNLRLPPRSRWPSATLRSMAPRRPSLP